MKKIGESPPMAEEVPRSHQKVTLTNAGRQSVGNGGKGYMAKNFPGIGLEGRKAKNEKKNKKSRKNKWQLLKQNVQLGMKDIEGRWTLKYCRSSTRKKVFV